MFVEVYECEMNCGFVHANFDTVAAHEAQCTGQPWAGAGGRKKKRGKGRRKKKGGQKRLRAVGGSSSGGRWANIQRRAPSKRGGGCGATKRTGFEKDEPAEGKAVWECQICSQKNETAYYNKCKRCGDSAVCLRAICVQLRLPRYLRPATVSRHAC